MTTETFKALLDKARALLDRVREANPARVRAGVVAVLGVAVTVGVVQLTEADVHAVAGGVVALLAIVQGEWTRTAVTPNAKVLARVERSAEHRGALKVVTGAAAGPGKDMPLALVEPLDRSADTSPLRSIPVPVRRPPGG